MLKIIILALMCIACYELGRIRGNMRFCEMMIHICKQWKNEINARFEDPKNEEELKLTESFLEGIKWLSFAIEKASHEYMYTWFEKKLIYIFNKNEDQLNE